MRNWRRSLSVSRSVLPLLLLSSSLVAACSDPPTLTALDPPSGQPRDVIFVKGDTELAQIVWDADTSDEKVIPGAYGGAFMFSVPPGTAPGPHTVKLQNSDGRSNPVTFNVPSSPSPLDVPRPPGPTVPFPAPRIDAVTLVGTAFGSSGVDVTLYVQGANIDVGATVWLEEPGTGSSTDPVLTELATVSHKVLLNNWFGVSSHELDYPIYHYSSAIVTMGVRAPGEELTLIVRNLDDKESDPIKYKLPDDAASVDSDGDGLLDSWETAGYHADSDGTVDVDLPGLGADRYRRDLFVELDIMDGLLFPPHLKGSVPDSTVFDALRAMFDSAPILNYNGPSGIHLEIDYSGKPCLPDGTMDKCSWQYTMFDTSPPPEGDPDPLRTRFSKLKEKNFRDDIRGKIYHYGIWAREDDIAVGQKSSGHSDYGDDFMISFDAFGVSNQTRRSQLERLAHELGHDLGLRHGGGDDLLYKPNYLSVMSYSWDLRTGWPDDGDRRVFVTCLPFYYAQEGAQEVGGAVPKDVPMIVNYSEGMARELDKPATGPADFCGLPVDFATIFSTPTVIKSKDFPNWSSLKFDGPKKGGWIP